MHPLANAKVHSSFTSHSHVIVLIISHRVFADRGHPFELIPRVQTEIICMWAFVQELCCCPQRLSTLPSSGSKDISTSEHGTYPNFLDKNTLKTRFNMQCG